MAWFRLGSAHQRNEQRQLADEGEQGDARPEEVGEEVGRVEQREERGDLLGGRGRGRV